MSPNLGCYGDEHARTPNIDKLAAEGILFEKAFVPSPVCATCRGSIITGVYSASLGTHHMRSRVKLPEEIRCFPEYLRESGYYCTNNEKTDYNFRVPPAAWDVSSHNAHWRNRPNEDAPFFAVFNYTGTHESATRGDEPKYSQVTSVLKPEERHDPAKLTLPPYYPDTPKVREHWARYYNVISALDYWIAERLRELDEAGLADDTIVFFWSDHGAGVPRHKRWLYDTGLHVPLIVLVPEKWRKLVPSEPGERREQLVSLIDLGPTMMHLVGQKTPEYMQGQRFLGSELPPSREYIYAARDRMDESYDMARAVRDKRYKYIRNYMPWRPYAQTNSYGDNNDIMRELRRLAAANQLNEVQSLFMSSSRPPEELYDLANDPLELNNLAGEGNLESVRKQLSGALDDWMASIRDLGVVPEGMLERVVPADKTRYQLFRKVVDESAYLEIASAAKSWGKGYFDALQALAKESGDVDDDSLRVLRAEKALSDGPSTLADRDAAFDALVDLYKTGESRWDQVAAACVIDLYRNSPELMYRVAAVNSQVGKEVRRSGESDVRAGSLMQWTQRFKRMIAGVDADGSEK